MNDEQRKLVEDNMNIVYKVISRDYPTFKGDEDIIQSGMLGLCNAAINWDASKSSFSTYAWRCIRNAICAEFRARKPHSSLISLESPIGEDLTLADVIEGEESVVYIDDTFERQLKEDERRVFHLTNIGYDTEDVARRMGYSPRKVQQILRIIRVKWRKFNRND